MTYEVRHTTEAEWRIVADTMRLALLAAPSTDADWEKPAAAESWRDGLSLSAWASGDDGERCIGHAGAFDMQMLLPGGAVVPMAGVTRVGVLPTHRRQGVLTNLMQRLLRESLAAGRPIATLRASEAVIYGRFGFQVAGEVNDIDIGSGARIAAPVAEGTLRILGRDETLETVFAIHALVGFDRPGTLSRTRWSLTRSLEAALAPDKAAYVVVHTSPDGVDDGYACYQLDWPEGHGTHMGGKCRVEDIWGASPSVELALWNYLLEIDLIDSVRAYDRPIDDPLRFALHDQRHYVVKGRRDEVWLRLLDVDAALKARTYNPAREAVTIAVSDPLFATNEGVWRVTAEGAERVAERVADRFGPADLATTINGLSGAYLGGTSWHELTVAGVVTASNDAAVRAADLLFASRPLPRCGSFF